MPEIEKNQGDEKLLILPLGEESKKITQVISNDTARAVIELLADVPLSASDIAERLQVPLTTIVYNLENLESVGLIRVDKVKYSEKGREVKVYAPIRKLIVVVPEKTDRNSVADLLRKYVGVILAAVFASSLIEFFMRSAGKSRGIFDMAEKSMGSSAPGVSPEVASAPVTAMNETGGFIPTPMATPVFGGMNVSAIPAATQSPEPMYAASTNATAVPPVQTPLPKTGGWGAPDILTNVTDTITAHPGLMFLLGCIFVIVLFIAIDYYRRRKNG